MATIEEIKTKVSSNPTWVTRAILAIYSNQTTDEQDSESTRWQNGIGFNGCDAEILSSFAKQIQAGRALSPKQLAIAFKKMPKYAKQLAAIAQAKATGQIQ